MQQLYKQSARVASAAYLLQAAARPLSQADGSSNALLPYLDPPILRRYAAGPRRRASPTAELLYGLALGLLGVQDSGETVQGACQYGLYKALRATFAWVRDNVPLRLVHAPAAAAGLDTAAGASFAVPDPARMPDSELSRAVLAAMSDPQQLGGEDSDVAAALLVEGGTGGSCGGLVSAEAFAGAVPRLAAALEGLHGDLPVLQSLGALLSEQTSHRSLDRISSADELALLPQHRRRSVLTEAGNDVATRRHATAWRHGRFGIRAVAEGAQQRRRRQLRGTPGGGWNSTFVTAMPPSSFTVAPPAKLPKLFVPLVFHVMLYRDVGGGIGPAGYDKSLSYISRLVRLANYMAAPTNIQFYVKEARNEPAQYPYLLLKDRPTWLAMPTCNGSAVRACLANERYVKRRVVDWPRSINVFITSDAENAAAFAGYGFIPGSDTFPFNGHVYLGWDIVSPDGYNSLALYNSGAKTLLHELFHHLGMWHPFGRGNDLGPDNTCSDDDYVSDTPAMLGPALTSSFFAAATDYCMELFWETYGGDWEATYRRWSAALGTPRADMNSWADSCPTKAGYDELGNYMTYNTPVCFAALGHFTRGQAEMAHYVTAELNPILYAWGQYYAATSPSPPPQSPPPPEAGIDPCKVTRGAHCGCKESWSLAGRNHSFCSYLPGNPGLWCEVVDQASCRDCVNNTRTAPCIRQCGGTEWMCLKTGPRPPPPPPLPPHVPPLPRPPPPRDVPDECKVASNGCACRSTWSYGETFWNYCAAPDGGRRLFCQVEPSCPGFKFSSPWFNCNKTLTLAACNVRQVYLSQTRGAANRSDAAPPPHPKHPRRRNRPSPPPPPLHG